MSDGGSTTSGFGSSAWATLLEVLAGGSEGVLPSGGRESVGGTGDDATVVVSATADVGEGDAV